MAPVRLWSARGIRNLWFFIGLPSAVQPFQTAKSSASTEGKVWSSSGEEFNSGCSEYFDIRLPQTVYAAPFVMIGIFHLHDIDQSCELSAHTLEPG